MTEETKTLTVERFERKTFTTYAKKPRSTIDISRKGSVVKERCKQLTEMIEQLFPERIISQDDLVCLVQDYIGADKETVRSYCGYGGHIRAGRCGDNRIVGLSRRGYLETFGFLKKISGRRWMICQSVLVPQATSRGSVGNQSNEKISISPLLGKCVVKGLASGGRDARSNELEEEEATEKERNFAPMIYGLSETETAILHADPIKSEPNRAKFVWSEQNPDIRGVIE